MLLHATLGLALIAAVAASIMGPLQTSRFLPAFPVQLLVGAAMVLVVAWFGASRLEKSRESALLPAIALSLTAFVAGCLAASLLNLLVLGDLFWQEDWFSYVVTPLFWLLLIGLPVSLLLGVLLGLSLRARKNRPAV